MLTDSLKRITEASNIDRLVLRRVFNDGLGFSKSGFFFLPSYPEVWRRDGILTINLKKYIINFAIIRIINI